MTNTEMVELIFENGFVDSKSLVLILQELLKKINHLSSNVLSRTSSNEFKTFKDDVVISDKNFVLSLDKNIANEESVYLIANYPISSDTKMSEIISKKNIDRIENNKIFFRIGFDISKFENFYISYSY